jgi:23S rRNA (pseudouridine1915-N3)-methyltransferase
VRLWLAAIGRAKAGPERELYDQYAKRLSTPLTLWEGEEKRPLPVADRKLTEAKMLLAAVPPKAFIVALDERGRTLTSEAFAEKMGWWRDAGTGDLAFLIGGADGHDDMVRNRADFMLSLGSMTWPHLLVRTLIAEQLWRAQSILAGHPYHRA